MSLWLLLAAHLIADFSLQPADWAEKKTQRFKYLARHAFVYAIVIAAVVFLCIPWESARIPFVIIALSHFFIDWIRVYVDKKHEAPAAHFSSFVIDQVLHIAIIYGSVRIFGLDEQTRNWLTDLALTFPVEQILRYSLIFIIILDLNFSPFFKYCNRKII